MAEFRLSPDDFGYLIQRRRLSMLRAFAPYLLAALLAAAALSVVSVPAAMLPLGMALAWSTNAYVEWFAIRRDLLRHLDFAAEQRELAGDGEPGVRAGTS